MRVLLTCPYAWDRPGGVQSHIRSLARALRDRGHDVLVAAPRSGERTNVPGVVAAGRAVPIPANGSVAPISFGPGAAAAVRAAVRRFRPDVIHAHEPLVPSVSLLAVLTASAPVVGTFHAASASSLGYRMARPALERIARRLVVRTAVSDAARSFAARYFPGDYEITPNGTDVHRFAGAPARDFGPDPAILFLGRLERRKGIEVLVQAMTHIADLKPRLVVAGTGSREGDAGREAERLRVETTWLGRLEESEIPGVYRGARVYCAPGLGGESFGIVLLEAMAAGTPIVCSDLPGYRAVVGDAALLVSPGEPGPLADALRKVLTDPATARRLSRAGRKRAGDFDWGTLVGRMEELYQRAHSMRK